MASSTAREETHQVLEFKPPDTSPHLTGAEPATFNGNYQSGIRISQEVEAKQQPAVFSDQHEVPETATGVIDEIQILKAKILELERRSIADRRGTSDDHEEIKKDIEPGPNLQLVAEMQEYRRREASLYRHRKEWEMKGGPGDWQLWSGPRDYLSLSDHGPWRYNWQLHYFGRAPYNAPDPFSHACSQEQCDLININNDDNDVKSALNTEERDEYDYTIDYGDRRERLRKSFEWEMDRLYLNEETDRRRLAKAKEAKEQRQMEQDIAKAKLKQSDGDNSKMAAKGTSDLGTGTVAEDKALDTDETPKPVEPFYAEFEWHAFKRLGLTPTGGYAKDGKVCIVDVLVGDPVIDDRDGRQWYGYSGRRRLRKGFITQANVSVSGTPVQEVLPERIRIRSKEINQIMAKILSAPVIALASKNVPIVFVRPFKAILYCEQTLRDWCTALEEKFSHSSGIDDGASARRDILEKGTPMEDDSLHNGRELIPSTIVNYEPPRDNKSTATGEEDNQKHEPGGESKEQEDCIDEEGKAQLGKKQDNKREDGKGRDYDGEDDKGGDDKGGDDKGGDDKGGDDKGGDDKGDDNDDPDDITRSRTALDHLKCLLGFTDSVILARRAYLDSPTCHKIHFSDLWLLFRPGIEVIRADGKQAYRVIEVNSAPHRVVPPWERYWVAPVANNRTKPPFRIKCVYIDFDGKHLGPVNKTFDFKRFEGEQDVTSLEVYPLRLFQPRQSGVTETEWKDFESMAVPEDQRYRQKLMHRGAKFLDVISVKHMYYAGPTLGARDEIESQVVIDFETAFSSEDKAQQLWKPELNVILGNPSAYDEPDEGEEEDGCRGECCRNSVVYDDTFLEWKMRTDYTESLLPKEHGEQPSVAIVPRLLKEVERRSISDDELVIMSHRVFGFVLRSRKWVQLDLSFLNDAYPSEEATEEALPPRENKAPKQTVMAFDRLVLEKGHRPMIESLVAQHFRDKELATGQSEQVDIVKGKGKGLILLLHGAPGVGKTSTAGDLGTTAREVEKALETNFALASRWGCILLLDEADVFLAVRTKEDFIRNGLVAAFLRVMEYYTGILFLTTNRVGDFDEAFTSRIHISLYYPELNQVKTVGVFKINMDMIEERFNSKRRRITIDKVGIGSFASRHFENHPHARWNGRQVRNACQTALALAEFEAQGNSHKSILKPDAVVELGVSHFETVQRAYLEFTKYMHDLFGTYASRRAKEEKLRAIWIDENDRVVGTHGMGGSGLDKRRAFVLGSQAPPRHQHQQQGFQHQPPLPQQHQMGYHQQGQSYSAVDGGMFPHQQPQQSHHYSPHQPTPVTPSSAYNMPGASQMMREPRFHSATEQTTWNLPTSAPSVMPHSPSPSHPGFGQALGQSQIPQVMVGGGQEAQPTPPPTLSPQGSVEQHPQHGQHTQQAHPYLLNQGVQAMYAASGHPGATYLAHGGGHADGVQTSASQHASQL